MSNLYEILEVSEKASKEVIDKAYHVLAKKYHPDLHQGKNKKIVEEKMKKINEAYNVLENEVKRKEYDEQLRIEREEKKRLEEQKIIEEMRKTKTQESIRNSVYNENEQLERLKQEELQRNLQEQENNNIQILQNEVKREYTQAYRDYWRSIGYKIKEPWTLKRFIELLKVLGIFAIIILAIWLFPPTHKLMIDFYEGNVIIKSLVDIIGRIFQGIGLAIVQFFQDTF